MLEETIKGYQNKNREYIKNDNPNLVSIDMGSHIQTFYSNKKLIKFDESKDFTVGELINALSKYDKNLPVTVVMFAPTIGDYDCHIHKIGPTTIYGYDREDAIGIFIDDYGNEED